MAKTLLLRKLSPLEYHYKFDNKSPDLHEGHHENGVSIRKIEEILKARGVQYDSVTRESLPKIRFEDYERVISAGGDGTVIALAFYNKNIPQLNLKTDKRSRGILCNQDIEKTFDCIFNGDYIIENWNRQDIFLDHKFVGRALNEICIGEDMDFSKAAKYEFSAKTESGDIIEDHMENSGLIVVTGTGSSAWGSCFERFNQSSDYFKYTTIMPNIGKLNQGISLSCRLNYKNHSGKFAIDTVVYDFPRDSILEIKLSEFPLRVIKPKI